jgi:mono/diheme cytochrome c family protein
MAARGIARVSTGGTLQAPSEETLRRGLLMFQGQCLACHTREGYRAMDKFLKGRDIQSIRSILGMLHKYEETSPYRAFMPPLVGTEQEVEALAQYLNSLVNPIADPAARSVAMIPGD